jgi:UV excision repair protein RAD23
MKIIVKNLKGTQFEINVEPSYTVKQVKDIIQEEQKIEAESQKLVAVGKVMADDKTVEEYKLKDGDFIVVMIAKPKVKKEKKPDPVSVNIPPQPAPIPPVNRRDTEETTPPQPTPTPAPFHQGDRPEDDSEGSGILRGEALESTLKEMQDMGFPRDE